MKSQKLIASVISLSMFASVVTPALANQGLRYASGTNTNLPPKEKMIQERKGDVVKDKIAVRDERLERQKKELGDRYVKAIADLDKMATRTEEMIAKFQEKGVDSASSTALMEIAKTKIAIAKTELANFQAVLAGLSTTTMSTTTKAQIKEAGKKVEIAAKDAKKALVDVINSLNNGMWSWLHFFWGRNNINASSTATTSIPNPKMEKVEKGWNWFKWFWK